MLKGLGWLLGFHAAGELVCWSLRLPISGAVCGMALLFASLIWRGDVPDDLQRVTDGLLANMPILFVPVGAGLIVYLDLFQRHWLMVVVGVVGGTFATLAATSLVVRIMAARPSQTEACARATPELIRSRK